jgi:hypothetical protein
MNLPFPWLALLVFEIEDVTQVVLTVLAPVRLFLNNLLLLLRFLMPILILFIMQHLTFH